MANRRIGAEMPGQLQRQLHAGRKFCKTLVDAELEIERAVLMPQHDRRRDRRIAGAQRHDLALAGCRERRRGAADEGGVAVVLHSAVPRWPFQPLASSIRNVSTAAATSRGVRATSKRTSPCSARRLRWRRSSFSFFAPERVAQQFIGVARRIEAGADMGLQHARAHAVAAAALR